ncbi:hypothetical protein WP8W19C02_28130 [Enterobacter cloacae]|nr:hypothetical protein DEM28_07415 [Enterobacter mori]BBT91193.1 hypothetical protein WP8W19C02_28130 [Enterobacter cloacae]
MMNKKTIVAAALLLVTGIAHAEDGVQYSEYQAIQAIAQCGYIANTMMSDNTAQVMDLSLKKYVAITKRMTPGGYDPSPADLATDYALFFQQTVSDTESEMFDQIRKRGLPLEPGSWVLVARDWWTVKSCNLITRL